MEYVKIYGILRNIQCRLDRIENYFKIQHYALSKARLKTSSSDKHFIKRRSYTGYRDAKEIIAEKLGKPVDNPVDKAVDKS